MNNLASILFSFLLSAGITLSGQNISVMTFNIRYDNPGDNENAWGVRKDDVVKMIAGFQPDFLGIQEGLNHQVEFILENLSGYKYIGVGRSDGIDKGEYCAFFYDSTKYTLIEHKSFWLSDTPEKVSVGWDAALERICTYGKFKEKKSNEILHIFNTHFDHVGTEARIMSAKLLLGKIDEFKLNDSHIVLMGDLNAVPTSEPVLVLKQKLDYGLEISQGELQGPAGTFNAFDINSEMNNCIDYIFTNQLDVLEYRHIDERRAGGLYMSDHLPVLMKASFSSGKR